MNGVGLWGAGETCEFMCVSGSQRGGAEGLVGGRMGRVSMQAF